jgi:hypothetical protein
MWLEEKKESDEKEHFLSSPAPFASARRRLFFNIIKKFFFAVFILVILIIVVGGILSLVYYNNFKTIYAEALSGKNRLEIAQNFLLDKNFAAAANEFQISQNNFLEAKNELSKLNLLKIIPIIKDQAAAFDNLLTVGIDLTDGLTKLALLGKDISATIDIKNSNFDELSSSDKKELLKRISESEPIFIQVKDDIDRANVAIEAIPRIGLLSLIKNSVDPLRDQLPQAKAVIDKVLPMVRVLPRLAGYPNEQTYLFLLENNAELRPTGGFIGTYGILKLNEGEISYFKTDNIYNIDLPAEKYLKVEAPWQLQKYLKVKYWFLRDSNWSPDFATSAENALKFYKDERGVEKNINGVIAITPEVIVDLLNLTGPIQVEDLTFTSDNFFDVLEQRVEFGYYKLGIPASQRKEIIGQLADEIKAKLFSMPLRDWSKIIDVADRALKEKQALVYMKDSDLEDLILARNWGGVIRPTGGDYLMIVDANLAALKTDSVVEKKITYQIREEGKDLVATASINYYNKGSFTSTTTRLRTYTRFYVTLGSELVKGEGMLENDKLADPAGKPGQVEVGEEAGKTYFGGFISIEPGERRTLSFKYKLPQSIQNQIAGGNYSLIVEKQAGTLGHGLTLDLQFDKNIKSASLAEETKEWGDNFYRLSTDLRVDRDVNIGF